MGESQVVHLLGGLMTSGALLSMLVLFAVHSRDVRRALEGPSIAAGLSPDDPPRGTSAGTPDR